MTAATHGEDPRIGATVTSSRWTEFSEQLPRYAIIVGVHLAVVLVWHLVSSSGMVRSFILPSPTATLMTLFQPRYHWLENTWVTAVEIFAGYGLAVVFGVVVALLFSWFRVLHMMFFPLFVTISLIPKVALGPLLVVWMGYGITTNIFFAFILSFFPILITTARGLREVEPDLLDLVRSLKGSRMQIFRKIQLPGALPYIVGEFVASGRGLGYLMIQVQGQLDTAGMFMAVIILTLLGVLLYVLVQTLERIFVVKDARLDGGPA
jgi:NitT/TauT family transport system permease protein